MPRGMTCGAFAKPAALMEHAVRKALDFHILPSFYTYDTTNVCKSKSSTAHTCCSLAAVGDGSWQKKRRPCH